MSERTREKGRTKMSKNTNSAHFDAFVIGAGFSGLYMLHRLRDKLGMST